tara:strand:- start:1951 stop:2295 length:345 start_codon:yes stop_codon:yes gene_type:complete
MAIAKGIKRKVSHHRRILSKNQVQLGKVGVGDIIQFNYTNQGVYDKTPLVLVLEKTSKVINGINLNYLKEFLVQSLLKESDWKNLKRYSMYKNAFRTYKKSKVGIISEIEYKRD